MHEILYKMQDILKMLSSDETLCNLSITEYCEELALAIEPTILLAPKFTIVHEKPESLVSYVRMFLTMSCNIERGFQS
jgi:hypothetical protein